ncbi:PKD domain-containing protein [Kitasatospora sp. NPDC058218]|uniref:PKD domain-containing protein n=1 Tax=Kitasatospora sp. NPDC058218 TaxID=3346385 RepID=UPI0036DDCABF
MSSGRRVGLAAALVSSTVIGSVLPAVAAHAEATYLYVNNRSEACSDTGPGSQSQPFCSIQTAADTAQPGQTVRIDGGGDYLEQVTLTKSGTPRNPITFEGLGEPALTPPTKVFGNGGQQPHAFVLAGVHDIAIKHLSLETGEEAVLVTDSARITVDGTTIEYSGRLRDNDPRPAIRVSGKTSDVTVSRNRIEGSGGAGVSVEAGVTGTVVTTNALLANRGGAIAITDAPGTVVNGNSIGDGCAAGIALNGNSAGATVVNNVVVLNIAGYCHTPGSGLLVTAGSTEGTRADYNVVFSPAFIGAPYTWNGSAYWSPTDFANAVGQGKHDLATDPKFQLYGAGSGQVAPTADTPVMDSADTTAPGRLDTDIFGHPRVDDPLVPNTGTGGGIQDRGAVERQNPFYVSLDDSNGLPGRPLDVLFSGGANSPWYPATTTLDFGDGSPVLSAPTLPLAHTYAPGKYTATLTAKDTNGLVKQAVTEVDVQPAGPLAANVSIYRTPQAQRIAVYLDQVRSPWPVSSYTLDFGDGQSATGAGLPGSQPVEHVYTKPGQYKVRLTVTDDHARTATGDSRVGIDFSVPGEVPIAGRWSAGKPATNGMFTDGLWALRSTGQGGWADVATLQWGQAGDLPAVADWDGVGYDQLGLYRSGTFVLRHADGSATTVPFGEQGDIPVPGYWDGNGHAQLAIYRPSSGMFAVRHDDGSVTTAVFGNPGDTPVAGDWDGVGHFQLGIFRSSTATFALRHDDGSVSTAVFGNAGDRPMVGDWFNKGRMSYGIYRPSDSTYALSGAYAGTWGYAGVLY